MNSMLTTIIKNYDWLDAVSRTGVQHNHVVSLSNGNDKGSYYISFGYTDNKGVIEKSEQEKYTGRINADQQIKILAESRY